MMAAAGVSVTCWSSLAEAEEGARGETRTEEVGPATPRVSLRHDLWVDVPVTIGLAVAAPIWTTLRGDIVPSACRLCDGGGPGQVNPVDEFFREALRRPDPAPAKTASDVLAFGAAPLAAVGLSAAVAAHDGRLDEAPLDTLLLAEATVVTLAVTEGLKAVLPRERPFFHAQDDPETRSALVADSSDVVASFPSGHTSTTFALAAAGGTIATMRGYRLASVVWIAGGLLAATTGYLRMAADVHYFTDVLAGAAIGTGVGAGVPLLFHGAIEPRAPAALAVARALRSATITSAPVAGGRVVSLGWAF